MSGPRFLLDRSRGQRTVRSRLEDAGWSVTTLAAKFGDAEAQRMQDETWIAAGTAAGFILLTKDHRVATRPLEAHAIYTHDARVVSLASGSRTGEQMAELFLLHERRIHGLADARGPFVYSLSPSAMKRKTLNLLY